MDDGLCGLLGLIVFMQQGCQRVVVHSICDAVRAQNESITRVEWAFLCNHFSSPFLRPEVAIQDIPIGMRGSLFSGDRAGIQEGLCHRMVLCQLLERLPSHRVNTAIANARDIGGVTDDDDQRNRGSHSVQVRIQLASRYDFRIGMADSLVDARRHLLRQRSVEIDQLVELLGNELHCHFAGLFTRRLTTHAIRNDEVPTIRIGQVIVLVVLPEVTSDANGTQANRITKGFGIPPNGPLIEYNGDFISDYPQPLFQIIFKVPGSSLPMIGPARIRPLCQFTRRLVFINHTLQFRLLLCRQFSKGIQNILVCFHEELQDS